MNEIKGLEYIERFDGIDERAMRKHGVDREDDCCDDKHFIPAYDSDGSDEDVSF